MNSTSLQVAGNLDFLSTLGALWDWDDEGATYKQRFKNSKSISIFQPTISLLGGKRLAPNRRLTRNNGLLTMLLAWGYDL
jgi:hypothetical protein